MSEVQPHAPPPPDWCMLTSVSNTAIYIRIDQLAAFGEAPEGYEGASWITLCGTSDARYVLETVEQIAAILTN